MEHLNKNHDAAAPWFFYAQKEASMKYIIMCGGQYDWKTPRQLTEIFGEPVVARTIRLLRQEGVEDIAISATDPRFARFGVPMISHENDFQVENGEVIRGSWVNAFFPTDEPTCYIFGDVVFSQDGIRKIVATETSGILFFGSTPPFSPMFIKKYAEPFAFKVADQPRFRGAIDFVNANLKTGIFRRHPIAWELWQVICGRDVREIDYDSVTAINDFTCDIDYPADAKRIEAVLCAL